MRQYCGYKPGFAQLWESAADEFYNKGERKADDCVKMLESAANLNISQCTCKCSNLNININQNINPNINEK